MTLKILALLIVVIVGFYLNVQAIEVGDLLHRNHQEDE